MHTWRPQVLLLVKPGLQSQTVAHPKLLGLLKQLKGARGLCILGSIVPGRLAQQAKLQNLMERALRRQRDENKLAGFTQVTISPTSPPLPPHFSPTSPPHLPHISPTSHAGDHVSPTSPCYPLPHHHTTPPYHR